MSGMLRKNWRAGGAWLLVLVLGLAACGGNASQNDVATSVPTSETAATPHTEADNAASLNLSGPNLGAGTGEDAGAGAQLPGCSDPNDEECPAALQLPLDGEASADGVHIRYPARYFDARTGADAPEDTLIVIEPSERNKYDERAVFTVYWADSVEEATAALDAPESAEWQTETLHGVIAVSKDTTQDPPITTTIGAMTTPDGRVLAFKLTVNGKYGWDLWSRVYEDMLDSLRVE